MKRTKSLNILFILGLIFLNTLLANSMFIEPEIGLYKPSDSDFDGDNSLKFGGNFGMNLQNDYQVYGGYKLWKNEFDDIDEVGDPITQTWDANFIIIGGRKIVKIENNPFDVRIGGEFLISNYEIEYDDKYYDEYDFTGTFKGNGFAIEGGVLYDFPNSNLKLFAGINYLLLEVELEEVKSGGQTYAPNELGISKEDSKEEADGTNFKVSLIVSL